MDRDASASSDVPGDHFARHRTAALGVIHQHTFDAIDEDRALGPSAYSLKQLGDGPRVLTVRFKRFWRQQVLGDSAGSDSSLGDGKEQFLLFAESRFSSLALDGSRLQQLLEAPTVLLQLALKEVLPEFTAHLAFVFTDFPSDL